MVQVWGELLSKLICPTSCHVIINYGLSFDIIIIQRETATELCSIRYLNILVQVPELLHVGESLDATPAAVGQEVNRTAHIEHSGISQ